MDFARKGSPVTGTLCEVQGSVWCYSMGCNGSPTRGNAMQHDLMQHVWCYSMCCSAMGIGEGDPVVYQWFTSQGQCNATQFNATQCNATYIERGARSISMGHQPGRGVVSGEDQRGVTNHRNARFHITQWCCHQMREYTMLKCKIKRRGNLTNQCVASEAIMDYGTSYNY